MSISFDKNGAVSHIKPILINIGNIDNGHSL